MQFFNKTIPYDSKKYNFDELLEDLYQVELNQVHTILEKEQELFKAVGKDTQSDIYKIFYDNLSQNIIDFYHNEKLIELLKLCSFDLEGKDIQKNQRNYIEILSHVKTSEDP